MFRNAKNTLQQGAIGLTRAAFEYQRLGYTVSIPLVDAQDYDLVIEKDNIFYSVQCKTTSKKHSGGNYWVDLRSIKTNTRETVVKLKGIFDLLFVLCSDGSCYSIPSALLLNQRVTMNSELDEFRL